MRIIILISQMILPESQRESFTSIIIIIIIIMILHSTIGKQAEKQPPAVRPSFKLFESVTLSKSVPQQIFRINYQGTPYGV